MRGETRAMSRGRDGMPVVARSERASERTSGETSTGGTVAFGKEFRSMDFLAGIRNRVADQYVCTADVTISNSL